ncbi:MAG: site-2 protease family protein [Candidatus Yonathbacteria bacterium CG_4_10_14_3_um_filter_47_65]|uniref:Site-2 protease family protein n=2 Tax=Parcubacteria group TaxID=1794811 RepID=A0A2M8D9T3_9BACT|nr:MAG: hypothetical protein AUJ44_04160 [Candidatus Nomurabacteria bacterium CG1_02_47_685]PIP04219.1 MAG: site-2 protease family protein [Candidatus Yonathbacteria bacterium CG23_combo_of_CG06-09_8_20_14_all_46_18]PIQ31611.1 MAG: site-2 protease family protein [Candidatus Yonathbacteria bacterium CG17_big_fil_post_rev_8_21_14_2_50_46_19]PIX56129.1 MAG: site-2 protease family protein [Candidatus Yonathbacteria bacterium CG_4_10_14_3_um_filter_47_65]PIY57691.1 MAG: site-2 protease family protei
MQADPIFFAIFIVILIFSVIAHEISHGYVAHMLGDPTAKLAGRLTLDPRKHLDPLGSFIVPALMYFGTGMMFGWAKPVPYNPYNLRNQRWGTALVGAAGAGANLLIALVLGTLIRFGGALEIPGSFLQFMGIIVALNLLLAVFNLIPIPPLDGSKVLFAFLPLRFDHIREFLERYALFFLLLVIFFGVDFIHPIIGFLYTLITGSPYF